MLQTAINKKSKNQGISWKICLALVAYYGSLLSLVRAGVELGSGNEVNQGLLGPSVLGWLLAVGGASFVDRPFRKLLSGTWGLFYWTGLLLYTVSGIGQGSEAVWLRIDLLLFLWLIGGLALFRLIVKAGNSSWHLLAFIGMATFVLYYSQILALEDANVETLVRVIAKNSVLFFYSELLLVPTGIALGILARKGIAWLIPIVTMIGLHFFSVTILSATRASTFSLLAVLIFSSVGLSYQLYNGVITTKKSVSARAISLLIIIGVVIVMLILFGVLFSENSLISKRIEDDSGSGNMRSEELADALTQVSSLQFVIGGGLGFAFNSTLGYPINALHVGIFTFLLKFGILIFVPLVIFFYFRLPFLYLAAWLRPFSMDAKLRSAILTVLPGIFGWLVIVSLSGGYNQYSFLGLGFGLGAFLHIKDYGLVNFFPSSSKQLSLTSTKCK
ncbi:hypothetical protein [Kamptonema formosum]|uniref:hypothetical protein n=1 Tax=Kamptonema formosum TaxID=331992 RepID=UPI0003475950|nr:hypothetical protein [Oscillatoria sp. PCC 10802]